MEQEDNVIPGQITLQIIHDPALLQGGDGQLSTVTSIAPGGMYTDEPGVAQTLLNIGQPGMIGQPTMYQVTDKLGSDGSIQLVTGSGDDLSATVGDINSTELDINSTELGLTSTELGLTGMKVEEEDVAGEDEKRRVAEDIRQQIRELCNQLADVGEESYLVSVRVNDGACEHLGSIKGDHYCLLRQEMLQDFHDFCLGIEEEAKAEDDFEDDDFSKLDDTQTDSLTDTQNQQEEDMEIDIGIPAVTSSVTLKSPPPPVRVNVPAVMTPKVIVLKKDPDGKKVTVDHQYTTAKTPTVTRTTTTMEEKENESRTNVLFLCDVCKNVFNDIADLRAHKLAVHDESDYNCDKCSRIFSLKKTLDRHMVDAHSTEKGETKIICDSCVLQFNTDADLEIHIQACHNNNLPMKCDVCEQTFPDISKMMDHRKIHFDYDSFCTKCWQGFFDYLELEEHVQSNCRYKEALYKCDICGKKYTKLASINKHIDTHPIHAPHVCRMCGRGFDNEKDLKYHRTAAHIIRPFKCDFCEKTFKKKESLIEHRRIHLRVKLHSSGGDYGSSMMLRAAQQLDEDLEGLENVVEEGFECNTCGIVLPSQSTLDQHIHQHETATEQHQCDRCSKLFFSKSLLNLHCRKEHKIFLNIREDNSVNSSLVACEWDGCNKTFYDRTKWKYHMKYHETRADKAARGISLNPKPESMTCDVCGKVLKYKSYLKAHMLTHSKEQPHQCDLCGMAYTSAKRLNDHIRVHKGEKPFKCRVCEKSFTSTTLRNQHMVIHWGYKTYICDVCGKGFMSRKHFHDHMRIHNGEQPHRCDTCGKDFIYYRSLVRHSLTHIDPKERPKPYKCQFCGKEYTEVTGYKHHVRSVHTGENPFQCDICGDAFHRNDKLKRHMKSRHGKTDMKPGMPSVIVTTRQSAQGTPMIIKAEAERQDDLLQIVQGSEGLEGVENELHVDVIQQDGGGTQQVYLIGLGNDGGETTYLQETQVIEGPDGVRYIIAGSGEELQVIESGQQLQDGEIIEGDIIQQVEQIQNHDGGFMVMSDGQTFTADQETLTTLANMASVAEVADIAQD